MISKNIIKNKATKTVVRKDICRTVQINRELFGLHLTSYMKISTAKLNNENEMIITLKLNYVLTGLYQFNFPNIATLIGICHSSIAAFLAIWHEKSIYFPSKRETGLRDAGAVQGN